MPDPDARAWRSALLQRHRLDSDYLDTASAWFDPLAATLAAYQREQARPVLFAFNGCQGSGKTTLCDYLCTALSEEYALGSLALSLDDFYLTLAERRQLAATVHPLLATRGVPGTHDMGLLLETLERLLHWSGEGPVAIPRFDKAADDRCKREDWEIVTEPVQVVLLEGWCLGASAEPGASLANPINSLEREEDPDGRWRAHVDAVLGTEFPALYGLVDQWIMLRAPSFDCVYAWRREQERKLAATLPPDRAGRLMDDAALERFIQHYERLTRQCLAQLPQKVHHLFMLDDTRRITDYRHNASPVRLP